MRKNNYLKTLLISAALLGGVISAWADGEISFVTGNVIGAEDNSDGWYGAKSEIFEIGSNKTLVLKFKSYTATDEQLNGTAWASYFSYAMQFWGGGTDNLFMRADGYGWQGENNTNGSGWYTYNGGNFPADFRTAIDGADVVMVIKRFGTEIRIIQEVTTTTNDKYYRYFVSNYGSANSSIWAQLTIDRAHVKVTEGKAFSDSVDPTVQGVLVGTQNNASAWWNQFSDYFYIAPEGSLRVTFKNYSTKLENYHNWNVALCNDVNRGGTGYAEYLILRSDSYGWNGNQSDGNTNGTGWFTSLTSNHPTWPEFRELMDGATINMTITRSGAQVTVRAEIKDTEYYEELLMDCGDGTQTLRAFFCVDHSSLDIQSISTSISSVGYSTFSSSYALDLDNMTGATAYYAYATDDSFVRLKPATGTVAAGEGLILRGEEGANVTIPVAASGTAIAGNMLVGCPTGATVAKDSESGYNNYVLAAGTEGAEFQSLVDMGATIGAGKAYLRNGAYTGGSAKNRLTILFGDDDATSIHQVAAKTAGDGAVYNVAGQRVNGNYKGIVIKNGKKYWNK